MSTLRQCTTTISNSNDNDTVIGAIEKSQVHCACIIFFVSFLKNELCRVKVLSQCRPGFVSVQLHERYKPENLTPEQFVENNHTDARTSMLQLDNGRRYRRQNSVR